MDKVAGGRVLARDVRLEISVDPVLQLAVEGLVQQSFKVLQAVRIVGQTEFAGKDKQSMGPVKIPPNTKRSWFYCVY